MSFITTKSKSEIYKYVYKKLTSRKKIPWVKGVWHEELELGCLLAKESSIYGGQLHFDPASESEYANPRNQDI